MTALDLILKSASCPQYQSDVIFREYANSNYWYLLGVGTEGGFISIMQQSDPWCSRKIKLPESYTSLLLLLK